MCVSQACQCGDTGAACGTNQACVSGGCVYSHTITVDGTNDFVFAVPGSGESIATTSTGYVAYVAWDAANLYIGYDGVDIDAANGTAVNWLLVYLDTGAGGSTTGQTYSTQTPLLPFSADYHVRWRTDDVVFGAQWFDSASWVATTLTGLTHARANQLVEIRIPFASIGNPTTLGLVTFMIDETGGSEWTYAGLYSDTWGTDGYDRDPTFYLGVNRASALYPNDALNKD
jgi:hypothetical protein